MRAWVAKNVNAEVADKLRILYGGSGACWLRLCISGGCVRACISCCAGEHPPAPPLVHLPNAPAPPSFAAAVNDQNCETLANLEDVDGFLVSEQHRPG